MVVKVKAEALSAPFQGKSKKGFLQKFIVSDGLGGREVVTVYSDDLAKLQAINGEVTVRPAGDFFFLV
jgi:hypothetical protein